MRSSDAPGVHALSRFWRRLFVFCVPLALAGTMTEFVLAHVPNSYSVKRDNLKALAGEVNTLIVGSSNAYYGISPEGLSGSAFNLANVNEGTYYHDKLLTDQLPNLPNLKRVIIGVSYITLFVQLTRGEIEDWRQYYYYQEWGIPPRSLVDRLDVRMWSRLALSMPPFPMDSLRAGFQTMRTGVRSGTTPNLDSRGWWMSDVAGDVSERATGWALTRHHGMMHESYVADSVGDLEHLLSLLDQRNVEKILVTPPVWHTYADGMRADTWDRVSGIYERLAREHRGRYLCFLRSPQLPAEDFYDPDHLNSRGAVHFTAMLEAALERPQP